jgi:hypothetical protein
MTNAGGDQGHWCTNEWPHTLKKLCAMPTYNLVRLLGHLTYLYTGGIQMLGKTPGASSPHKNMEKKFIPLLCLQHLIFKVQPNVLTLNLLHFYLWGHLKALVYSATENEQAFHQCIFDPCQTICNYYVTYERVPQSTVRCVHQIRCRIFWANVVKCGLINNMNSTVIKLGTGITSVVGKILLS